MSGNFKRENREIPMVSNSKDEERSVNVSDGTADVYAKGKSDGSIVPSNQTNNDGTEPSAESAEGRGSAKRNVDRPDLHRTPNRTKRRSHGLDGVREAARRTVR